MARHMCVSERHCSVRGPPSGSVDLEKGRSHRAQRLAGDGIRLAVVCGRQAPPQGSWPPLDGTG
jgi:hypothetical protein